MSLIREQACSMLRRLVLPVPERERTLNVVVAQGAVPDYGIRCLCIIAATYAWRAAHENGCSKIRVHHGSHKHEFDSIEVLRHLVRRQLGFLPSVKRINGQVPRYLATRGHQALGNFVDTTRPTFSVPVAVTSDPVSGLVPAGEGATSG